MKSTSVLFKSLLCALIALCGASTAFAQQRDPLPHCSGRGAGSIYFLSADTIFRMDPANPGSPVNTGVLVPTGSTGLAVSRNLNGGFNSPTYYTVVFSGGAGSLYYYDNLSGSWVATTGTMNTNDIAGGGGFIFGLFASSGIVFKYDGLTTKLVTSSAGNTGSADLAADCSGNFYIINQIATTPFVKKYNSNGVLLATYTITGTVVPGAGGLGVNGNTVYYDGNDGKLYSGVLSGSSISFSASSSSPFTALPASDFGTCGVTGLGNATGSRDTVLACGGAVNVPLTATGSGPYSWTVISGNGTITGSGSTVLVNATTTTTITVQDANCDGTNTLSDTIVVYVATATINLGPKDRYVGGCQGFYVDTIIAHVTNTSPGILYAPTWTPYAYVIGGVNDTILYILTFFPTSDTTYTFHDSTSSGCGFSDTVRVHFVDSTPHPEFDFRRPYGAGCNADTVQFINLTANPRLVDSFAWSFGDTTYSDAISPLHIYKHQDIFRVTLIAKNGKCTDSVTHAVFIDHPLIVRDSLSDDSVCSGTLIRFYNKSSTKPVPANTPIIYAWNFGDGTTSNIANPTHVYKNAGTYYPTFTISNGLGCVSTLRDTIRIDSLPFLQIITPDTLLCEGMAIHIKANYLTVGLTGTTLNFGDLTGIFQNTDQVTYSYEHAGTYPFSFIANYRICPPDTFKSNIVVHPFPGVNLGPDTVLCPNGAPVVLSDRTNAGNASAKYLWNTGATTPSIFARDNGTYWVRVNVAGCTGTDSIMVSKDCYIDIPNSFTPNGDGTNDYFLPRQLLSRSLNAFHLSIFNRWGQMVYETRETGGRGWDGKFNGVDQPQGVYVYMIDVTFDNTVNEHYTGNVTMLR